jgi:hypothetical protein
MSLINQALRKAQRDRTPERISEGDPTSPKAAGYGQSGDLVASGFSPALLIGLALTVAVLIGLVVGLSIVAFKGDSTGGTVAQQNFADPRSAPGNLSPSTDPVPATIPVSGPTAPQITPPAQTQASTEPAVPGLIEELRRAREAAQAEAAKKAAAQAETDATASKPPEVPAAEPSQAVIDWLGASKISGVRLAGGDSRVILNGDGYSVGEVVNFNLGLKVLVIQESRVLFEDENGIKYMKRL